MALTNDDASSIIIKTDARGRTRYSEDYKRQVLEAFEQSGLSGVQFAQQCGVKYPTFASWLKKHRESKVDPGSGIPKGGSFLLAEIRDDVPAVGMSVNLPGGMVARASTREEIALLAELIKALA